MKRIFLVDGDNNINTGLHGIEMLPEEDYVMIFHSRSMEITKFKKRVKGCSAKVDFIESVRAGKNSVDFQITTELGFLSQYEDLQYAYIISGDKGYDAAIDYVKRRYSGRFKELERKESIFDCFQMAFILKAKNKQELNNAFIKEYGTDQGNLVYAHLKTLFGDVSREEVETKVIEKVERAEKKVIEVQQKVQGKMGKAVAAVKREAGGERVNARVNTRAQRKNSFVKYEERREEKREAREEKKEAPRWEVPNQWEAPKQNMAEIQQTAKGEEKEVRQMLGDYNIPLRFGTVRTEEQNQSFYKNKDLRKKKPAPEAAAASAIKSASEFVPETVEEKRFQKRTDAAVGSDLPRKKYGGEYPNRRSYNSGGYDKRYDKRKDFQRDQRERNSEERDCRDRRENSREDNYRGKVVPIKGDINVKENVQAVKAENEVKNENLAKAEKAAKAESMRQAQAKEAPYKAANSSMKAASVSVPNPAQSRKASGQSGSGFFGRWFGRKK